jgi:ParB family transcriptional regulator, chromosome partitioning protein
MAKRKPKPTPEPTTTMETVLPELEQKSINLDDIITGYNHRSEYEADSMQELTDSIREMGVLQPVLVRPAKEEGKYELVAGRRRYIAAVAVRVAIRTRNTIPAIIRELTDDEVVETQLVENLQRKDVHPMDEAAGFKRIMEQRGWTVHEIAARVGKKPQYVAARMKLNELALEFQKAFYKGRVSQVDVTKLFKLSIEQQQELYYEEYDNDDKKFNIDDWEIKKRLGSITNAPFDTTDASLLPEMGACTGCPFNTASNTLLFPEAADNAQCGNSSCYEKKSDLSFESQLKAVLADPAVVLISEEYYIGKESKKLITEEHTVYRTYDVDVIHKPDPIDLDEYKEQLADEWYDDEEEMMKQYNSDLEEYKENLKLYEEACAGAATKGFIVEGNNKGKFIYLTLKKGKGKAAESAGATSSKAVKEKEKAGTITVEDIDAELDRLNDGKTRKREIDEEKLAVATYALLESNKSYPTLIYELRPQEKVAMVIALCEFSHDAKKAVQKRCKLKDNYSSWNLDMFKYLTNESIKEEELKALSNIALRVAVLDKFKPVQFNRASNNGRTAAMIEISKDYNLEAYQDVEVRIMSEQEAREQKLDKRVVELKKKKGELMGAAEAKPKKSGKKKSAKDLVD